MFTYLAVKYLDKQQKSHNELAKQKMLLEINIREKESNALINGIDLLVKKVTGGNKDILDSNNIQREEHGKILEALDANGKLLINRHKVVDIEIGKIYDKIKCIDGTSKDIKEILTK